MTKSKLSRAFTTVTPFSKLLAMILFIAFPFVGFYLGVQYQKMITPHVVPVIYQTAQSHTTTPKVNWQIYTNTIKTVSIQYPPTWKLKEKHELSNRVVDNPNEINTAILSGKEGEVVLQWGPMGFGGGCDKKDHKTLTIKNTVVPICNGTDNGEEYWSQIYPPDLKKQAVGVRAIAYKPNATNSPTVAAILSTLAFSEPSSNITPAKPPQQLCTQEAKQCLDGSYVSRTEPNCAFAACPK